MIFSKSKINFAEKNVFLKAQLTEMKNNSSVWRPYEKIKLGQFSKPTAFKIHKAKYAS